MLVNAPARLSVDRYEEIPVPYAAPGQSGSMLHGLSDYQANDPLGDTYCDQPYFPRNWTPPNMRPPVPEVRRFKNPSDDLYLTEGIEWMWFYSFRLRNPSWSEATAIEFFARHTRTDAGYTNKVAWNSRSPRRSFVLGINKDKKPMQLLGIVCPGGNMFKSTGTPDRMIITNEMSKAVWNLDYDWMVANLTKTNAKDFAASLPDWLLHTARIVHPIKISGPIAGAPNGVFLVTNWDGDFCVPHITSAGRSAVIDGFHVCENWLQSNRLTESEL